MARLLVAWFVLCCCALCACGERSSTLSSQAGKAADGVKITSASGRTWEEGKHFEIISARQPVSQGTRDRIRVVEFFWYECPHCYALEPHLVLWNRYNKSADV